MTDREYSFWQKTLERNVSMRTNLLTFSFTTVLAILGIAISNNSENVNPLVYLVPYILIIPFEGRIAYYRLIHARISAYLEMVVPEDTTLDTIGVHVPEKQTKFFDVIAALNNYEMFLLSLATAIVFYLKYPFPSLNAYSRIDWLMFVVPFILSGFVFLITAYAFDYGKWKERYRDEWNKYGPLLWL